LKKRDEKNDKGYDELYINEQGEEEYIVEKGDNDCNMLVLKVGRTSVCGCWNPRPLGRVDRLGEPLHQRVLIYKSI
jgi:hypothetical protein